MDGGHNSVPDSRAEGDDTFPRMLVERVQVGEITLRHAEESARQSPADLSRPASRLAADAVRLARRDPWAAVVPGRIAAAAADSEEPVGDSEAAWIETNLAWVEIAARAVEVCPDARTQQHAAQRGERVRHWAKVRGSTEVQARACTLIAALVTRLHRVPPPLDYAELDRPDWATRILLYADERLATEMLKPGTFEFPENPLRPPPWEQAASAAEAHLREALAVEPSGSHGAPAELARLLRATGADPSEPGRLSYQALDMARGLCRAGILAFQRRLGVSIDFSSLAAELSEIGVEASVAELGQRDASRIAVEVLDCITDKLPEAALAWAQRWEPLVVATGDDSLTSVHWTLRASAAASALTSRVDRSGSSLDALAPEERLFVTAMAMLSANQSLPASNIFATLSQSAGDLVTAHPAAMMWMAIQSRMRGVMEGDSKDRLRLLPDVILGMINLGLRWWPLAVVSAVMRGLDQSASGTADLLVEFLERLVIPLERFHPEMARQFVHDIAGIVFSGRSDPVDRDHLIRLFQIAGGARYAAAVRAGALVNTAGDGECRTSLERARRWQEQQEAPTVKGPGDGDGNLLPEVFLTSYATGAEQSDGADTETVLGNVQMHADAVLDSRVLAAVASDSAPTLGLSELQAALDESTALLITFIGGPDSPTGHPSVLTALISQKTIAVAGIKWENLPGVMHHFEAPDGGFWLTSPMGMTVAELRRRV